MSSYDVTKWHHMMTPAGKPTSTLIEAEQDCTKKCTSHKRRNKVRVGEQKAGECIQDTLDKEGGPRM